MSADNPAYARQVRYVVQKAPGIGGDPIPADEPCIVIRAQDKLALSVIDQYLALYRAICAYSVIPGAGSLVIEELEQHRAAIEEWQRDHPTKFADR